MEMAFDIARIDENRLEKYARNTALAGKITGYAFPRRDVGYVKRLVRRISKCYTAVMEKCQNDPAAPKAAVWLMDNFHLIKEAEADIIQELRSGERIPTKDGETCVHIICRELMRTGGWENAETRMLLFLRGYQSVRALQQRELTMVYTYFRLSCLELICTGACELLKFLKNGVGDIASVEEGIKLLHNIQNIDFGEILESANAVETTLRKDPSGMYLRLDENSRARCRHTVTVLAKSHGKSEGEVAAAAIKMAKTSAGKKKCVAYWLMEEPLGRRRREMSPWIYILLVMIPPAAVCFWLSAVLGRVWLSLVLYFPVTEAFKNWVDSIILRLTRPDTPLKLDDISGMEREGKTACVIAELLTSCEQAVHAVSKLERYYLANRDSLGFVTYGILADLRESANEIEPENERIIAAATEAINHLNGKYDGGFCLLVRKRRLNPRDKKYMGWERKRGAIIQLTRLLRGADSDVYLAAGAESAVQDVQFIITLDSDTKLSAGSARELIGTMLFPLNTPEVDKDRRIVKAGYGIIQPRVSPALSAANRSIFSMLYAGQGGIDPYGGAVGDIYQDMFRKGSYTGKGLIHVDTFAQCMDGRFPENKVLSHDLLEGSYLRCAYLSNTELTDGFPHKVMSFFTRLDRWTRGDWQIISWLLPKVKNEAGTLERNPIDTLAKWKIFDNLRRSLRDIGLIAAILVGCITGGRAGAAAFLTAVVCAASAVVFGAVQAMLRPTGRIKYHSTVISGFWGCTLLAAVQLLLLPYSAWVSLRGIITALWRMTVSKRGLLNWVTSADADKLETSVAAYYVKMLPAVIIALAILLFSTHPAAFTLGIMWLMSPLISWYMSCPQVERERLGSERDRKMLYTHVEKMLLYFTEHCSKENNFLPPDNVQFEPYRGEAHRTSPTNIGLGMLSVLAGLDLGITEKEKCLELLEQMTESVEKLPKFKEHLYNWYDTETLQPMEPKCISAVDSGNFIGCMVALRKGLEELSGQRAHNLAARISLLERKMNTAFFYDAKRKLMHMGWDCGRNAPMSGYYDMLESEARLLSYIACARGEVPRKHWRRLGRTLTQEGSYQGLVSWTGTMFEYLMPRLLLPGVKNSLLWESDCFCVYAQRRHCSGKGVPWGESESAYAALDKAMNYRYKAHGVQALGLKRGLDRELVISPYSTYLAMCVSPEKAVRNLRKIENLGASGRYGLIEALDFTEDRVQGGSFEPVQCYMAHHVGMSIVACANALADNVMVRRFMSDDEMGAMCELLEEKVPVNVAVIPPQQGYAQEHFLKFSDEKWDRTWEKVALDKPECLLLSSSAYSLLLTDGGMSEAQLGDGRCVYKNMQLWLKSGEGEVRLLPGECTGRFSMDRATYCVENLGLNLKMTAQVSDSGRGEVRRIEIENSGSDTQGELMLYFEPVLEKKAAFEAHPTFSKLSVESSQKERAILFRRRSRSGEKMIFLAARCDRDFAFDTSRMEALGRGGTESIGKYLEEPAESTLGAVLDPCGIIRVPFSIKGGESQRISIAIAVGDTEGETVIAAEKNLETVESGRFAQYVGNIYKMTAAETDEAMEMLSLLAFPNQRMAPLPQKEKLWRHGISGDIPIAFLEFLPSCEEAAYRAIKKQAFIGRCGFESDLVIVTDDAGEYMRPEYNQVYELLRRADRENELNVRGGVFIVQAEAEEKAELREFAAWTPETERGEIKIPDESICTAYGGEVSYEFLPSGEFEFKTDRVMPYCAWGNILTNGRFGYMATDAGTGHMWNLNARENMLTPWLNDPLATTGTERVLLNGTSVFAHGEPCRVLYGFGYAVWEHENQRVTAFVPANSDCRVLIIESDQSGELSWQGEVVLGSKTGGAYGVASGNAVVFTNAGNTDFPDQKGIFICRGMAFSTNAGHFEGRCSAERTTILVSGCGAGVEEFMYFTEPENAFRELEKTKECWRRRVGRLNIATPDSSIDAYMNGWALYQTLACRILGRSSIWQCGGAYGFRDQLQDICAVIPFEPDTAAEHIVRSAGRQYLEGDVMHWWHENAMGDVKGVRTMCSDDLLWLPYAVCRYIECWDDMTILSVQAEYLTSMPLEAREQERYETPMLSGEYGDVFDHCVRALSLVLERGTGEHGLCLMLQHDWNDGMNKVGVLGQGESVWLTWFAVMVLERFAPICSRRGEVELSERFENAAKELLSAAEKCWDGNWYLRAFYDDGVPIGSSSSDECTVDSISQSFAAFAGGSRASEAVNSAVDWLFDRENSVVRLLTPPFNLGDRSPGYIAGYVPGVRENGGQYTHGAVWLAMACIKQGMTQVGYEMLSAISPADREQSVYRSEPYAICGDVYSNPQHMGRGGWSWYTGAAGWYHQAVMEWLLGIKICRGRLTVEPHIPMSWSGFRAVFRTGAAEIEIEVIRGRGENSHPNGIKLPCAEGRTCMKVYI